MLLFFVRLCISLGYSLNAMEMVAMCPGFAMYFHFLRLISNGVTTYTCAQANTEVGYLMLMWVTRNHQGLSALMVSKCRWTASEGCSDKELAQTAKPSLLYVRDI